MQALMFACKYSNFASFTNCYFHNNTNFLSMGLLEQF
ncbi:unnamed protein product [Brugia timori]|uniref:Uncharacterized protein n=1 Tax=Brugia timori TaxID=42155 RepID=A0A0R3QFK2_9BILA|nr:unnamed protein product [Brugia timori]